jgi:hypothetical protein
VSLSNLTPFGEDGGLRSPDDESTAAQGTPEVSPELALVDPTLSSEQPTNGSPEKEVIVSSNAHSEGTFFVDQQPVAQASVAPAPAETPLAVAPVVPAAPVEQEPVPAPVGGGMRDVPLGTLIFRAGLLAEEQLEDALQEGMRTGKRLGEVLAERGLIKDSDLGRLLAGQQGLPYVEVATLAVDPEAVRMLPDNIARMQNALAFALDAGVPVVAVADPTNELVIENVRRALGTEPGLVVAAYGELAKKINEVYSGAAPVAQPVEAEPPPVVDPAPAPEAVAPPEPVPASEPVTATTPEPPAQVEQPAAPVPTPMPTSMPPAEERAPEPQPLVVEPLEAPAPAEVPPLHAEAAQQPPLAPEPVVVPAAIADPVQVVEQVEPAAEQQPAEPAIVVAEPAATVEPAMAPEPVAPAEPAVTAEPPAAVETEAMVAPAEAGLFTQAAEEALALSAEPPAAPAPEPVPPADPAPAQPEVQHEHAAQANGTAPEVVPTHFVILRLAQEDHVEIGGFASKEDAESFARTVVGRIGRAEEQAEWPVFEGRFVRPQTIVSVDVVEETPPEWGGSSMRTRSFDPGA